VRLALNPAVPAGRKEERNPLRHVGVDLRFEHFEVIPFNFLSFPCALVSTFLFRRADNPLLRLCDRADRWLARRLPFLAPSFRQAIFVIG